jgi:hypothetical protein
MKVTIQVDQAVWERSTFEVEVPDGLEGEALRDALNNAIDNYDGYGEEDHSQGILDDPVHGIDSDTKALLPDGTELDL